MTTLLPLVRSSAASVLLTFGLARLAEMIDAQPLLGATNDTACAAMPCSGGGEPCAVPADAAAEPCIDFCFVPADAAAIPCIIACYAADAAAIPCMTCGAPADTSAPCIACHAPADTAAVACVGPCSLPESG